MANKTDERLLDSFTEAAGSGMSGSDGTPSIAEEVAGAMQDALSAGMTPEAVGATPGAAQGQAQGMWDALSAGMTAEAVGATPEAAQGPVRTMWDALSAGKTAEAGGATLRTAQGQAGGDLYGESGTAVGSNVHSGSNGSSGSTTNTGSSTASKVESAVTTYLDGGGIVSLIPKLIGLFSRGSSTPPVLEKYAMPSSISFESADTGSGLSASDFDQMGAPRSYSSAVDTAEAAGGGTAANSSVGGQGGGTSGSGGTAPAPQISVTVQTMDAQSFLDNSEQIARAVRGAMLNLGSINDVVNEL